MNQELDFLQNLFNQEAGGIYLPEFMLQILITTLLAFVLGGVYVRFGNALSNRRALAKTLVLVSLTTMLIISIVKSSLALSLGLVGALSIVRFRTAIKEPEELAYFFIAIAIGVGVGAGQLVITIVGAASLFLVAFLANRKQSKEVIQNLIIQFEAIQPAKELEQVVAILQKNCTQVELRRLDEGKAMSEIAFVVSFREFSDLVKAKEALQETYPGIRFSFLEIA